MHIKNRDLDDKDAEIENFNQNYIIQSNEVNSKSNLRIGRDHLRATTSLIIICSLFLVAEFPQAVLLLISVFDFDFYVHIYRPLGDFLDILVFFNYSISFLLYCYMSQKFRSTFFNYLKRFSFQ